MIASLILGAVRQAGVMSAAGGGAVADSASQQKQLYDTGTGKLLKTNMQKVNGFTEGFGKFAKQMVSKPMGMAGINLSISSLLRQSQIFTGVMGALFQILGGFIDVILAPFMPILGKVIQMLAGQIPRIRDLAQKGFDWLAVNVFPVMEDIYNKAVDIWNKLSPALFSATQTVVSDIYGFIKDTIMPRVLEFWDYLEGWIDDIRKPIAEIFAEFGMKLDGETIRKTISLVYDATKWVLGSIVSGHIDAAFATAKVLLEGITLVLNVISEITQWGMNIYRLVTDFDNYKDIFKNFLVLKWEEAKGIWANFKLYLLEAFNKIPGVKLGTQITTAQEQLAAQKDIIRGASNTYQLNQATYQQEREIRINITQNGIQMNDVNEQFAFRTRLLEARLNNENSLADASGFAGGGG